MSIQFACPYCDKVSSVPDSFAGKKGKCPNCKKVIEVPDPNADVDDDGGGGGGGGYGGGGGRGYGSGGGSGYGGDDGGDMKDCRYCGESIKKVAKKCKYCGEFLDKRLKGGRRGRSGGPRPDSNLGLAIAATLLCCWPVGIVSIIYAVQVNSKYNAGDSAGARAASEKARSFAYWAIGLGLVVIMLQLVLVAAGG